MCGLYEGIPSDHPVTWWYLIHCLKVECKVAPNTVFPVANRLTQLPQRNHNITRSWTFTGTSKSFRWNNLFQSRVSDMYLWPLCLACPVRGNIIRQVTLLVMIPETECLPTCIWKALCTDMTSLLPACIWVCVHALWLGDTDTFYIFDTWSWVSPWTSALR